ncbi:PH domain-containing protein [Balamuthia mandrillaris]
MEATHEGEREENPYDNVALLVQRIHNNPVHPRSRHPRSSSSSKTKSTSSKSHPTPSVPDEPSSSSSPASSPTKASSARLRRPQNGFFIYANKFRGLLQREFPHLPNSRISKLLGQQWGELSKAERDPYVQEAARKKNEFLKAHPEYRFRRSNGIPRVRPKKVNDVWSELDLHHQPVILVLDEAQDPLPGDLSPSPSSPSPKARKPKARRQKDLPSNAGGKVKILSNFCEPTWGACAPPQASLPMTELLGVLPAPTPCAASPAPQGENSEEEAKQVEATNNPSSFPPTSSPQGELRGSSSPATSPEESGGGGGEKKTREKGARRSRKKRKTNSSLEHGRGSPLRERTPPLATPTSASSSGAAPAEAAAGEAPRPFPVAHDNNHPQRTPHSLPKKGSDPSARKKRKRERTLPREANERGSKQQQTEQQQQQQQQQQQHNKQFWKQLSQLRRLLRTLAPEPNSPSESNATEPNVPVSSAPVLHEASTDLLPQRAAALLLPPEEVTVLEEGMFWNDDALLGPSALPLPSLPTTLAPPSSSGTAAFVEQQRASSLPLTEALSKEHHQFFNYFGCLASRPSSAAAPVASLPLPHNFVASSSPLPLLSHQHHLYYPHQQQEVLYQSCMEPLCRPTPNHETPPTLFSSGYSWEECVSDVAEAEGSEENEDRSCGSSTTPPSSFGSGEQEDFVYATSGQEGQESSSSPEPSPGSASDPSLLPDPLREYPPLPSLLDHSIAEVDPFASWQQHFSTAERRESDPSCLFSSPHYNSNSSCCWPHHSAPPHLLHHSPSPSHPPLQPSYHPSPACYLSCCPPPASPAAHHLPPYQHQLSVADQHCNSMAGCSNARQVFLPPQRLCCCSCYSGCTYCGSVPFPSCCFGHQRSGTNHVPPLSSPSLSSSFPYPPLPSLPSLSLRQTSSPLPFLVDSSCMHVSPPVSS